MDWGLLGSGSPGRPPPLSHSSWALWYFWWWCRASCPRMSVDIVGANCDQCRSTVHCCFTSTETVRLIRTGSPGRPPPLSHSSWVLWYFWWRCRASCPRMLVDILGAKCDQCRSTAQGCFTSTETVRFIRTGSSGRPPPLSHSSWVLWYFFGSVLL